jgi:hypothetical protein
VSGRRRGTVEVERPASVCLRRRGSGSVGVECLRWRGLERRRMGNWMEEENTSRG